MSKSNKNMSLQLKFLGLLALVMLLTLASGTIYGRLTQRWGPSVNLLAAADHVRNFPKEIGPWRLLNENDMADNVQDALQCAGYVNRQYVHEQTGQNIGMAIIVGPPGPTAVHTPEICYSSRSHKIINGPEKVALDNSENSFWGTRFQSKDVGASRLQVYHAWSDEQHWQASDQPRIQYGGRPLLYKIQVSGPAEQNLGNELPDPAFAFLESLAKSTWSPQIPKNK